MVEKEVVYDLCGVKIALKEASGRTICYVYPTQRDLDKPKSDKERALETIAMCPDGRRSQERGEYWEIEALHFETDDTNCTPELPSLSWQEWVARERPERLIVNVKASYEVLSR